MVSLSTPLMPSGCQAQETEIVVAGSGSAPRLDNIITVFMRHWWLLRYRIQESTLHIYILLSDSGMGSNIVIIQGRVYTL